MNTPPNTSQTENERYGDEVLNANWLPQMVLAALGLNEPGTAGKRVTRQTRSFGSDCEAEDFMQRLYRAQE